MQPLLILMARIDYVDLSQLSNAIKEQLDEYRVEVHAVMVEVCEDGIKFAKQEIKQDLDDVQKGKGRKSKRYRSTFTTRKINDTERILWNRQYPLSHLLEDGHFVYNQYGGPYDIKKSKYGTTGDHTKKFKIWEITEKAVSQYVVQKVQEKLK